MKLGAPVHVSETERTLSLLCRELSQRWLFQLRVPFECSVVGHAPPRAVAEVPGARPARPWLCTPEVVEDVNLYCPFLPKTYASSIDVVPAVAEELLYAVFFGFTKPIKRPCETNLALTPSLYSHNTLPTDRAWAAGRRPTECRAGRQGDRRGGPGNS